MRLNIPTKSIMWGTDPATGQSMTHRMRTLIQVFRVVDGQKTELMIAHYSANGGVHGDNNHPVGSEINFVSGRFCYVVYNLSTNQVPINMTVFRGDSTNTNSIWGTARDISGNACYQKVEAGEKKEIYFDVENYDDDGYYHLNCNAWFVTGGFEQSFTPNPIDRNIDYGLNPLRIVRAKDIYNFPENPDLTDVLVFSNFIRDSVLFLPNTRYFEGSNILNPFFVGSENGNTLPVDSGYYPENFPTPPPNNPQPNTQPKPLSEIKSRTTWIISAVALFTIIARRRNENTN